MLSERVVRAVAAMSTLSSVIRIAPVFDEHFAVQRESRWKTERRFYRRFTGDRHHACLTPSFAGQLNAEM